MQERAQISDSCKSISPKTEIRVAPAVILLIVFSYQKRRFKFITIQNLPY